MYLYFDNNGILKEIINDKALRQGNSDVNVIYVYVEDRSFDDELYTGYIKYRTSSNGEVLPEIGHGYSFSLATVPTSERKIKFSKDRDLKYFKYGIEYPFFKITIPDEILIHSGTTSASIKIAQSSGQLNEQDVPTGTILTLGLIVFNIEESVIPDTYMTESQFNYILKVLRDNNVKSVTNISDIDLSNYGLNSLLFNLSNNKIYKVIENDDGNLDIEEWNVGAITSVSWGDIEGNINNQTDLKNALNSKASTDDIPATLAELSSDSTHRLVTDGDKQTWNAKQEAISDLATIRTGAGKGATAVQPAELSEVAFSGDYDDLSNKPTIPTVPVQSVNSKTGAVVLDATDIKLTTTQTTVQNNFIRIDESLEDVIDDVSALDGRVDVTETDINTLNSDLSDLDTAYKAADTALSARIDNISSIGRFLAVWNANTGTPTSEPTASPYTYHTGDYFRIGVVGNKIPTGSSYTTGGTNYTTTTETLTIGDVYYYDGSVWRRQVAGAGGTVQDVQINGTSILSGGVANIPVANSSNLGVFKVGSGLTMNNGALNVNKASDSEIAAKTNNYNTIVPSNLNKAVMEGLGNNSLTWSDTYKTNARNTIGAGTSNFSGNYNDLSGAPTNVSSFTNDANYTTVTDVPRSIIVVPNLLQNVSGKSLTAYKTYDSTTYVIIQFTNGTNLTKEQAGTYLKAIGGSDYVNEYNYDYPLNTFIVTSAGLIYKVQYTSNQLRLYKTANPFTTITSEQVTITEED